MKNAKCFKQQVYVHFVFDDKGNIFFFLERKKIFLDQINYTLTYSDSLLEMKERKKETLEKCTVYIPTI